jgi:hypothetical protein
MGAKMGVAELDAAARAAHDAGNEREALRHLMAANRMDPDPAREILIRDLRITDADGESKSATTRSPRHSVSLSYEQGMPVSSLGEVNADILSAAFADKGCLYLPNAIDSDTVEMLRDAVEASHKGYANGKQAMGVAAARSFARDAGACLASDSPHTMFLVCDMLERTGLTRLARDFIGEAPLMSASKFVLWKAKPGAPTEWHQDGRFLGDVKDIVSMNVWTCLTDCGESAPGMELVLEYLDEYLLSQTGNVFDWSVADSQVDDYRGKVPIVCPKFKAGDMLIFDHWLLHRTYRNLEMTECRYAIESWFFAPSEFPYGRAAVIP